MELPFERNPPELALLRVVLHLLVAERTGHGNYADYFRDKGRPERAEGCRYRYGAKRKPGHIAHCPAIPHEEWPADIIDLIGPGCHNKFREYVEKHNPYGPWRNRAN